MQSHIVAANASTSSTLSSNENNQEKHFDKLSKNAHNKFTVKHQHRIEPCNHKFVAGQDPRHRNCSSCWLAFFLIYPELVQEIEQLLQKPDGLYELKALRGDKFVKQYGKFSLTMDFLKQQQELQQQNSQQDEV